ncbi:immunoglobulin-like domain-containing protein [Brevibacillus dissolubilis]|uniref:immunoglobulin-like domain-containing protein n=1 Tax=Brevibacillus dissolubilis TaxID=1844116 RepID=UPI00159BED0D|nr:immunoglobulin-like domain-containing protein [Brevibacillus dissolubilis]
MSRSFMMRPVTLLLLICAMLITSIAPGLAAAADTTRVAKLTSLKGTVNVKKAGGQKPFKAFLNMALVKGDTLTTGADGSGTLTLDNGSKVNVGSNSTILISNLATNQKGGKDTSIKVVNGQVWSKVQGITNANDNYKYETPTAVMGIRGTLLFVKAEQKQSGLWVTEGAVSVAKPSTPQNQSLVIADQTVQANASGIQGSVINANQLVQQIDPGILPAATQDIIQAVYEIKNNQAPVGTGKGLANKFLEQAEAFVNEAKKKDPQIPVPPDFSQVVKDVSTKIQEHLKNNPNPPGVTPPAQVPTTTPPGTQPPATPPGNGGSGGGGNSGGGGGGGGGGGSERPTITGLLVNSSRSVLNTGDREVFSAVAAFSDGTSQEVSNRATWSTSNSEIATISPNGVLQANKAGQVTVTALYQNKLASKTITIQEVVQRLSISPNQATLQRGEQQAFSLTLTHPNGTEKDVTNQARWSVSDPEVANVSKAGVVTAKKAGKSTTVTAVYQGLQATATINVHAPEVTVKGLSISPQEATMLIGEGTSLRVSATYSDETQQDVTREASWSVADPSVATISQSGGARGLAAGSTTVTATLGDKTATARLVVAAPPTQPPVQEPTVETVDVDVAPDKTVTISGTASDSEAVIITLINGGTEVSHTVQVVNGSFTFTSATLQSGNWSYKIEAVKGTTRSKPKTGVVDLTAPIVHGIMTAIDDTHLKLTFNETLDKASAETAVNYTLGGTGGLSGHPSAAVLDANGNGVLLTIPSLAAIMGGTTVTVTVQGVKDVAGNSITVGQNKAIYTKPADETEIDFVIKGTPATDGNASIELAYQPAGSIGYEPIPLNYHTSVEAGEVHIRLENPTISADRYHVMITTNGYVFTRVLSAAELNEPVVFTADATYVPLHIQIAQAGNTLSFQKIGLYAVDTQGYSTVGLTVPFGVRVQPGAYNLQINAKTANALYQLYKIGAVIDSSHPLLNVYAAEMAEVTLDMTNWAEVPFTLDGVAALPETHHFSRTYETYAEGGEYSKLYLSKNAYDDLLLSYQTEEGYRYTYSVPDLLANQNQTISLSNHLRVVAKWRNGINLPDLLEFGLRLNPDVPLGNFAEVLAIQDEYGHNLIRMTEPEGGMLNGSVEIMTETEDRFSRDLRGFDYSQVKLADVLADVNGLIRLRLLMEQGPIPVFPYSTIVVVEDGELPPPQGLPVIETTEVLTNMDGTVTFTGTTTNTQKVEIALTTGGHTSYELVYTENDTFTYTTPVLAEANYAYEIIGYQGEDRSEPKSGMIDLLRPSVNRQLTVIDDTHVKLTYSEPVDETTALPATNYSVTIQGANGSMTADANDVGISSDLTQVTLTIPSMSSMGELQKLTVVVQHVKDKAGHTIGTQNEAVYPYNIEVPENEAWFVIKGTPALTNQADINVTYKNDSGDYDTLPGAAVTTLENGEVHVRVDRSAWNSLEVTTFHTAILTNGYLFHRDVDVTALASPVVFEVDETYLPFALSVEGDSGTVVTSHYSVNIPDAAGYAKTELLIPAGTKVPAGTYNVHAGFHTDSNAYQVYKLGGVIDSTHPTIEITQAELAEVTLNLNNTSGVPMTLGGVEVLPFYRNQFRQPYVLSLEGVTFDKLFISDGYYPTFNAYYRSEDGYQYRFQKSYASLQELFVMNMDTDFAIHADWYPGGNIAGHVANTAITPDTTASTIPYNVNPSDPLDRFSDIYVMDGYMNHLTLTTPQDTDVLAKAALQADGQVYSKELSYADFGTITFGDLAPGVSGYAVLTLKVLEGPIEVEEYSTPLFIEADGGELPILYLYNPEYPIEVTVGETKQLQLHKMLANESNEPVNSSEVVWTSDSPEIATVDANGVVTGIASGTALIHGSYEGHSWEGDITVTEAGPPDDSDSVTFDSLSASNPYTTAFSDYTLGLTTSSTGELESGSSIVVELVSGDYFREDVRAQVNGVTADVGRDPYSLSILVPPTVSIGANESFTVTISNVVHDATPNNISWRAATSADTTAATKELMIEPSSSDDTDSLNDAHSMLEIDFNGSDTADSVTQDVYLPSTGEAGTSITWYSTEPTGMDSAGHIFRPAYGQSDVPVLLKAFLTRGTAGMTKEFYLTVKPVTEAEAIEEAKNALTIPVNLDAVFENLELPLTGHYGSTITWESSDDGIISIGGIVIRHALLDVNVTLTATIQLGDSTVTKTFNVKVLSLISI